MLVKNTSIIGGDKSSESQRLQRGHKITQKEQVFRSSLYPSNSTMNFWLLVCSAKTHMDKFDRSAIICFHNVLKTEFQLRRNPSGEFFITIFYNVLVHSNYWGHHCCYCYTAPSEGHQHNDKVLTNAFSKVVEKIHPSCHFVQIIGYSST